MRVKTMLAESTCIYPLEISRALWLFKFLQNSQIWITKESLIISLADCRH